MTAASTVGASSSVSSTAPADRSRHTQILILARPPESNIPLCVVSDKSFPSGAKTESQSVCVGCK